jgi:hypothetical protein
MYTPIREIRDSCYNWPSEDRQIWRHISNYKLLDRRGDYASLIEAKKTNRLCLCGLLLPSRESIPSLPVQIPIEGYSIDFGRSQDDPDRGFWLLDESGAWYKLVEPLPEYSTIAVTGLRLCEEYIKFYDAVVYGIGGRRPLTRGEILLICDNSLDEVYDLSHHHFDLNFAKDNIKFFCDHAKVSFNQNCKLMKSLQRTYKTPPKRRTKESPEVSFFHQ